MKFGKLRSDAQRCATIVNFQLAGGKQSAQGVSLARHFVCILQDDDRLIYLHFKHLQSDVTYDQAPYY